MRDSNTNRYALADVLSGMDSVVRKDVDRYSFHCPLEHRTPDVSAEIWRDTEGRIGICCHYRGCNRELRQRIVRPDDDLLGRMAEEVLSWATI